MELFAVWTDVSGQEEADQFYRCVKEKTKGLHISKEDFGSPSNIMMEEQPGCAEGMRITKTSSNGFPDQ